MKKLVSVQTSICICLILLGLTTLTGWLTQNPSLLQLRPHYIAMVFNTGLGFIATGLGLLAAARTSRPAGIIQATAGVLLMGMATVCLIENFTGLTIADFTSFHAWLDDGNSHPGRMAPDTALGFLLTGAALIMMRSVESKARGVAIQAVTFIVLMLGLTGLVGYSLQLDFLYAWFKAARMAIHTSAGMILAGAGLWLTWYRAEWYQSRRHFTDDERIGLTAAGILVAVGLTTGVAGFSAQQTNLEKSLEESLSAHLKHQSALFNASVAHGVATAENAARRRNLLYLARAETSNRSNQKNRDELREILRTLIEFGSGGVAIHDANNVEILRTGHFAHSELEVDLGWTTPSVLKWDQGFYLSTRSRLADANGFIGTLVIEQRLPRLDEQLNPIDGFGRTGEMGMCFPAQDHLLCFPQKRNPAVYRVPRVNRLGKMTAMANAVSGKTGIFSGIDYRGQNVIAAHAPLTATGLGIVVKMDADELHQPIRDQLQWGVPILLLLIGFGAMLMRSQVRPLVQVLLKARADAQSSEMQVRAVVDNIAEGIITLDENSLIRSFNGAASAIFGYTESEALGLDIRQLMPPELRERHQGGMKRYLAGGRTHIVGKNNVDLLGLRKDGTTFHIELAVNEMHANGRRHFVGVVRDVTERKQAERTLLAEKERLRVTLSSIGDAVITTDTSGHVSYLNPVAEKITGWRNDEAIGLPLLRVFQIFDEKTGQPAPNPVAKVLNEGQTAALAMDTVLLARDGTQYSIEDSAAPILDPEGILIGVVLVFHDVSQARKMAALMTHQASHDALTGLINRREFERLLEAALLSAKAECKHHTMLYLDLDQFKIVNDTCGHIAGDELLRQLTSLLGNKLRQSDTLARLGGDEFGVLLQSCPDEPALRIAELLRQTVSDFHFVWHDKVFQIGVSIGLVTFSEGGITLADLFRMADAACYIAKDRGRNRVHVYTLDNKEVAKREGEMGWIGRIQKGMEEGRFVLYAQKILPLKERDRHEEHYEILLRLIGEDGSVVPPMAFIPAAERYGLMPQLDRWVIRTAFEQYSLRNGPNVNKGTCAINISGASICDEQFFTFVREQFDAFQVPHAAICFEITETSAIANLSHAAILIRELKAIGCRFSLDDFGSGMSSFAYLKHLPVDFLKIDGGFVKDMLSDPIDNAMVESINHIGHVMGIQTIAEFVENDGILEKLRLMGIDFAQGYGIEKPRPW